MSRGTLCVLVGLALMWGAWQVGRQAMTDVAILHVSDVDNTDRYVTLWAVEDAGWIWLRAARPEREWLEWLRERPDIELELDGESARYRAEIFEQPEARERVDELMREKYGWADRLRALLLGEDTVPVRLGPVD
jgi:hypothetical protein